METPEEAAKRNQKGALKALGLLGIVFGGCLLAMVTLGGVGLLLLGEDMLGGRTYAETWTPSLGCNVVGIAVRGEIGITSDCTDEGCYVTTASDDIIEYLKTAREDDSIQAILIDIDSPGGGPVASEEIANAIKATSKPTVAWVRQYAASGAYWIASAADTIVASPNSDVGSIGVSMSYLDATNANEQDGLTFNSLSTGRYKDTGSPDKPLTDDEKALLERDLYITHENFIAAIAENRGLSLEVVSELADGSTMLGKMALDNGLIDTLGGQEEAYGILRDAIGEEPEVCWGGL